MDEGEGRVYLGSRQAEDGRAWPVAAADVGRPRRGERSEGSRAAGGTPVLWRAANSCAAAAGVCSVGAFASGEVLQQRLEQSCCRGLRHVPHGYRTSARNGKGYGKHRLLPVC